MLPISLGVFGAGFKYGADKAKQLSSGQIGHIGAGGTPDYGLSEDLGRVLGASTTNQGGSNIIPGENSGQVVSSVYKKTGDVLNALKNTISPAQKQSAGDTSGQNTNQTQTTNNNNNADKPKPDQDKTMVFAGGANKTLRNAIAEGLADEYGNVMSNEEYERREAEKKAREKETRDYYNSAYDAVEQGYGSLEGDYQRLIEEQQASTGRAFDLNEQNLLAGKANTLKLLDNSKLAVADRLKRSSQDVADNLRQMQQATSMQLGAIGAGDSSATEHMAPYAYTKLAGKENTSLQRQANDQYKTIDDKTIEADMRYNELVTNLKMEKEQALSTIRDQYMPVIAQIKQAMIGAKGDRAKVLAGLSEKLMDEASQKLYQLEQYTIQRGDALKDWARNRLAQLNDYKIQAQTLDKNLQYDPSELVANELQAPNIGLPQTVETFMNPTMIAKRRKELGLDGLTS